MKRISITRRGKTTVLYINTARFLDCIATFVCLFGLWFGRQMIGDAIMALGRLF